MLFNLWTVIMINKQLWMWNFHSFVANIITEIAICNNPVRDIDRSDE